MPQEILISTKQTFVLGNYEDGALLPGQIRGRTLCTLISQGTELGWANGDVFPIRPGYAAVFEVTEIGDDVDGVSVGDRRFAMGQHRSTQTHDARHTLALPDGLAPDRAVLARLMGVSMTSLMTTKARPGDRVVVSGGGAGWLPGCAPLCDRRLSRDGGRSGSGKTRSGRAKRNCGLPSVYR